MTILSPGAMVTFPHGWVMRRRESNAAPEAVATRAARENTRQIICGEAFRLKNEVVASVDYVFVLFVVRGHGFLFNDVQLTLKCAAIVIC